jgi:transcriptional regulator with XRE-family HTH domain
MEKPYDDIDSMLTSTTHSINADWFKQQLEQKRLSQRKLARFLELDPSAITLTLQGRRRMQMDEATRIAVFLGVSVEDVLTNAGLPLQQNEPRQALLVGTINYDNMVEQMMEHGRVDAPPMLPSDAVAAKIEDRESLFFRALVFFLMEDEVNPGAIGRLSIAKLRDGRMFFARIEPGSRPGLYDLKVKPRMAVHAMNNSGGAAGDALPITADGYLKDVSLTAAMPILNVQP